MNWERFHYICRRALTELNDQESISDCIDRVEKSLGCTHYGETGSSDSLANKLLNEIKKNQIHDDAKRLLGLYARMDLSVLLAKPMQLKRVAIYLAYVTFVFIGITGIYQIKVVPAFLDAFKDFELSIPAHLIFYRDYWKFFALVIFGFLVSSLYIGLFLTKVLEFNGIHTSSPVLRFFTFPQIRHSYEKILRALFYPISIQYSELKNNNNAVVEHLCDIEKADMDLSREIDSIIKIEREKLLLASEKQMRLISVVIALIVIASIFHFMASAYSPIFVLGETI